MPSALLSPRRLAPIPRHVTVILAVLVAGCAPHAAEPAPQGATAAAPHDTRAALLCKVSSNCVNSFDTSGMAPLHFEGTAAQAIAALRTTLADFPEATVLNTDALSMQVVFTTPMGFKDLVDFKIDVPEKRIDYRSRSSFGLYDFGKNRSRMTAFASRFAQHVKR